MESGSAASEVTAGELAAKVLVRNGVRAVFSLSGGHIFPFYDGCHREGIRIVDVRHEASAVFASEALAKLTRSPQVAILTAGPGVTNAVSAMTTAGFNGSPVVVLAGRAQEARWGSGSLQELDHVPIVAPVVKQAGTVHKVEDVEVELERAFRLAGSTHRGPVFLDFPLDVLFSSTAALEGATEIDRRGNWPVRAAQPAGGVAARPGSTEVGSVGELLVEAERPVLFAGSDVFWAGAWDQLRRLAELTETPVFANGLGRGCLPADHPLCFSRARPLVNEADLVVVVGTPLDFRLSFGHFGAAKVVHIADDQSQLASHVELASGLVGEIGAVLDAIAWSVGDEKGLSASAGRSHSEWVHRLSREEQGRRAMEVSNLSSEATPIHPLRIYGELRKRLDHNAIVIGDGGDFVSFAGRYIDSYEPGCWLDPGPFGCLGTGLGYAIGARIANPDRQVVLLAGDGAFGFSGMDIDTLVRHGLACVIVVGNNGIWGLEKHPMKAIYGYDVAADLQPGCRYDLVAKALGAEGELVTDPAQVGPALDRALGCGAPYLVNVVTDPEVVYPRSSNLA